MAPSERTTGMHSDPGGFLDHTGCRSNAKPVESGGKGVWSWLPGALRASGSRHVGFFLALPFNEGTTSPMSWRERGPILGLSHISQLPKHRFLPAADAQDTRDTAPCAPSANVLRPCTWAPGPHPWEMAPGGPGLLVSLAHSLSRPLPIPASGPPCFPEPGCALRYCGFPASLVFCRRLLDVPFLGFVSSTNAGSASVSCLGKKYARNRRANRRQSAVESTRQKGYTQGEAGNWRACLGGRAAEGQTPQCVGGHSSNTSVPGCEGGSGSPQGCSHLSMLWSLSMSHSSLGAQTPELGVPRFPVGSLRTGSCSMLTPRWK